MKYIYHYLAVVHLNGTTAHVDGIVTLEERPTSQQQYRQLKGMLVKDDERLQGGQVVIHNLSLIYEGE